MQNYILISVYIYVYRQTLVRAMEHGRALVFDEADKASLEVRCTI